MLGVGPVAATTLIALLPELGARSPKTIAALVGLAPLNRDSGTFRGSRRIAGGRKRVRDALYMAAFAARRPSVNEPDEKACGVPPTASPAPNRPSTVVMRL